MFPGKQIFVNTIILTNLLDSAQNVADLRFFSVSLNSHQHLIMLAFADHLHRDHYPHRDYIVGKNCCQFEVVYMRRVTLGNNI